MTRIERNANTAVPPGAMDPNYADLRKSLEQLSTGLRISKASDKKAGKRSGTLDSAAVDQAVQSLSNVRSRLGAGADHLDRAVQNLQLRKANADSAESASMDLDAAKAMAGITRNQILAQSSTAMLGQANATPQRVLELLK